MIKNFTFSFWCIFRANHFNFNEVTKLFITVPNTKKWHSSSQSHSRRILFTSQEQWQYAIAPTYIILVKVQDSTFPPLVLPRSLSLLTFWWHASCSTHLALLTSLALTSLHTTWYVFATSLVTQLSYNNYRQASCFRASKNCNLRTMMVVFSSWATSEVFGECPSWHRVFDTTKSTLLNFDEETKTATEVTTQYSHASCTYM